MLLPPGLVGLSLSYALSITTLLSGLIFSFAQTEMQLVSVERTEEYSTGLPTEPQHQNTEVRPSATPPDVTSQSALLQKENLSISIYFHPFGLSEDSTPGLCCS